MKIGLVLMFILTGHNLQISQEREKEIAKALAELGSDDADVRETAEKRLIELDAEGHVNALVKEAKDLEVLERGKRVLRLVKLNKRIGKTLWKNDPSFADTLACEDDKNWLPMMRKKLAENPDVLKYPDTTLFAKELLKDEKLATELIDKNRAKDCWWFFVEAINSGNDKIRLQAKSFFIMPNKGLYSPFTDDDKVKTLAVEILTDRLAKSELLHIENVQVLQHILKFTKKETQSVIFDRLVKLLEHSDSKKRINAIAALDQQIDAQCQKSWLENDQLVKLVDLFLQMISNDKDSIVRSHAIQSLNWYINTHHFFQLPLDKSASKLLEKSIETFLSANNHKDIQIRRSAAIALFSARKLNSDKISENVAKAMLGRMEDAAEVQGAAIHTLFGMFYRLEQKKQDEIVKILLGRLNSEDKHLPRQASDILYMFTSYSKLAETTQEKIIQALIDCEKKGKINLYLKHYFVLAYANIYEDEKESKGKIDFPVQIDIDRDARFKEMKSSISTGLKSIKDNKDKKVVLWRSLQELRYKICFLERDADMLDKSAIKGLKELLTDTKKEIATFEKNGTDYIEYEAKKLTKELTDKINKNWKSFEDLFRFPK